MLTGIHILLTYKCTNECDHCFLHCGPDREGTFTLDGLRRLFAEIARIKTVRTVYFEGGEPFLFYATLLEGLRMARAAKLQTGIVTNGYWATSLDDAVCWLRPIRELGVADLSVSDDDLHRSEGENSPPKLAYRAARKLGIRCATISIERPHVVVRPNRPGAKGKPVIGGDVLFKGRAAEKLTAGLPSRPPEKLVSCPYEDLAEPERIHVDAFGNVHLCQGLSMGNMWATPLAKLVRNYNASKHPIAGPLVKGGPAKLADTYGVKVDAGCVDECHLCYLTRKSLVERFPEHLAPRGVYGL